MPVSPADLFARVGLTRTGAVRWGTPVPTLSPGVYAISTDADPNGCAAWGAPRFDLTAIAAWIGMVPTMRLGTAVPTPVTLSAHLGAFWHGAEPIVYIGKATSLQKRIGQFYRHNLGRGSPHCGGHWLKTLTGLPDLWVHFASCDPHQDPEQLEHAAIGVFQRSLRATPQGQSLSLTTAIPFANRKYGGYKQTLLAPESL